MCVCVCEYTHTHDILTLLQRKPYNCGRTLEYVCVYIIRKAVKCMSDLSPMSDKMY